MSRSDVAIRLSRVPPSKLKRRRDRYSPFRTKPLEEMPRLSRCCIIFILRHNIWLDIRSGESGVATNPLHALLGISHNPLLGGTSNALGGWIAPPPPPPQPLTRRLILRIWDVEHGACAMLHHLKNGVAGRLAMIDSGDTADWTPSAFIRYRLNRTRLDYLFITNADQDHMSDLQGLWDRGVNVRVWHRNPSLSPEIFRRIKEQGGALTTDAKRYLQNLVSMSLPVAEPFDQHMGGIKCSVFWNSYPQFTTTNDLSLVVFVKYAGFKILFPGDLEEAGWLALLANQNFRAELANTDILVASHHGRENGYCRQVFDYCHPQAVVMSDKSIVHDTQLMAQVYHNEVVKHHPNGVYVLTTNKRRHVLTTRRDGHIQFEVNEQGRFTITTENAG
jgi:beta-lactamase superfamily II metal-dependent hydrolase